MDFVFFFLINTCTFLGDKMKQMKWKIIEMGRWGSSSPNLLCSAKGVGGTPGKNLTVWVVACLVLACQEGIGNLTYASSKT